MKMISISYEVYVSDFFILGVLPTKFSHIFLSQKLPRRLILFTDLLEIPTNGNTETVRVGPIC